MATVADLYRQILGREPDPAGLANWTAQFGSTVDPTEMAQFQSAAAPELAVTHYSPTNSLSSLATTPAPSPVLTAAQQSQIQTAAQTPMTNSLSSLSSQQSPLVINYHTGNQGDDGSNISNLPPEIVKQMYDARKAGRDIQLNVGRDHYQPSQMNKFVDYAVANNLPANSQGLIAAQVPSGVFTPPHESFFDKLVPIGMGALAGGAGLDLAMGGTLVGGGAAGAAGTGATGTSALTAAEQAAIDAGGATFIPAGTSATVGGSALTAAEIAAASAGGASLTPSIVDKIAAATGVSKDLITGMSGNAISSLISGAASLVGGKMTSDAAKNAAAVNERFARESIGGMDAANTVGRANQEAQFNFNNTLQNQRLADANAAQKSAYDESKNALTSAYNTGSNLQIDQFNKGNALQQPWYDTGLSALGAQSDLMGLGSNGAASQLSALTSAPGYQFRLGEGQKALERGAAARGGTFSGAAGKALTEYGQNFATNEYGNRLSQLGSVANTGLQVGSNLANRGTDYANTLSSLGTNYATNLGNLNTGYANTYATQGLNQAGSEAARRTDYANNVATGQSNLAANKANILTGLGSANANASIASANANQSGILGAGQALSNLFNPPKAQPTLQDLLKNYR